MSQFLILNFRFFSKFINLWISRVRTHSSLFAFSLLSLLLGGVGVVDGISWRALVLAETSVDSFFRFKRRSFSAHTACLCSLRRRSSSARRSLARSMDFLRSSSWAFRFWSQRASSSLLTVEPMMALPWEETTDASLAVWRALAESFVAKEKNKICFFL